MTLFILTKREYRHNRAHKLSWDTRAKNPLSRPNSDHGNNTAAAQYPSNIGVLVHVNAHKFTAETEIQQAVIPWFSP